MLVTPVDKVSKETTCVIHSEAPMKRSAHIRKLNNLKQLEGPKLPLIIHASEDWYGKILSGDCQFLEKLGQTASEKGFRLLLVQIKSLISDTVLETEYLQMAVGPRRPQAANLFHAHPSYILGFWYLDVNGYFWNSSLITTEFRPEQVDFQASEYFFNGVSGFFTRENISSRPQCERKVLPKADAFIPLQNIEKYPCRVHYLTSEEIIDTACSTLSGRVYVKLHPLHNEAERQNLLDICSRHSNAQLTEASVHDLIAASNVILSQNSAVGFEALMQKKPVLTCAKCDYHHASLVSQTSVELRRNLLQAPDFFESFPFEKYFYWFLGQQMLEPQKEEFAERAWARLLTPDCPMSIN